MTVDYYSNLWEVDQLESNATSKTVIGKLRQQFAQSNGTVECAVKAVKRLYKNVVNSNYD